MFQLFVALRRGQSVNMAMYILLSFSSFISCIGVSYYRKITLHEIKVLENNESRMNKINTKEEEEFHNKGN